MISGGSKPISGDAKGVPLVESGSQNTKSKDALQILLPLNGRVSDYRSIYEIVCTLCGLYLLANVLME